MKYMLMLRGKQADYDAMAGTPTDDQPTWAGDEIRAMVEHMNAINDDLADSGELVDAQGLAEPRQAKLVTAGEDGRPVVTDGPYGETREVLCGYWVVDVTGFDRAAEIAARAHSCPVPKGASNPAVIVQPIGEAPVPRDDA
jgi:hypothetical protein